MKATLIDNEKSVDFCILHNKLEDKVTLCKGLVNAIIKN